LYNIFFVILSGGEAGAKNLATVEGGDAANGSTEAFDRARAPANYIVTAGRRRIPRPA
jgi:hypothetical protein